LEFCGKNFCDAKSQKQALFWIYKGLGLLNSFFLSNRCILFEDGVEIGPVLLQKFTQKV
jgi:hypothetical protein